VSRVVHIASQTTPTGASEPCQKKRTPPFGLGRLTPVSVSEAATGVSGQVWLLAIVLTELVSTRAPSSRMMQRKLTRSD
jgi:hypothetical protein